MPALTLLLAGAATAFTAPPIATDGSFDDWSETPALVTDADDAPNAQVDLRAVHVRDDGAFVHLLVDFGRPRNVTGDGSGFPAGRFGSACAVNGPEPKVPKNCTTYPCLKSNISTG